MPTLNWIGKQAVVNHHRQVPYRLLHCDKSLSAGDPDAGNLLVQGDNLEALKALLPYYAGKVKCIYIDPPYNTGKEKWEYNDNVNSPEIKRWLGQWVKGEEEDLSRHDKWLCMIYPRMALLREFLSEDGAIFVSIDDNEASALKMLMDEVFGVRNHLCSFVWNTEGHTDNQFDVKINHEYILAYARSKLNVHLGKVVDPNTRSESNLWKGFAENSITKNGPGNPPSEVTLPIGFPCKQGSLNLPSSNVSIELLEVMKRSTFTSNQIKQRYPDIVFPVRLEPMLARDYRLIEPCRVFSGWANVRKLRSFIDGGCIPIQDEDGGELTFFLSENGVIYYRRTRETASNILSVLRNLGTTEQMRSELESMGISFPYPKPKQLMEYLLQIGTVESNSLILDSFAGSGTTAHAVLKLNKSGNGNRRFILVEMDENIAQTVTVPRLKKVIEGYVLARESTNRVPGLGGGFRFCKLGRPLFDAFGGIDPEVKFADLAAHVFFTETGSPIPKRPSPRPSPAVAGEGALLGVHEGRAIYLLFNGVLGDKRPNGGNVLTGKVLDMLSPYDGPKVVYGEGCRLGAARLHKAGVTFKQVPYDVKVG